MKHQYTILTKRGIIGLTVVAVFTGQSWAVFARNNLIAEAYSRRALVNLLNDFELVLDNIESLAPSFRRQIKNHN